MSKWKSTTFLNLLVVLALWTGSLFAQSPRQPNILFIFIDDMGFADPSCFGNPKLKTPHIDQLADEGIKLTSFYVNSPICSPSRVAVMTGQYPARWKIHSYLNSKKINQNRRMANWLDSAAPTTARLLKQVGYRTAHFGKWHIGGGRDVGEAPLPQAYGFDESLVCFEGLGDRILFPNDGLSDQSAKLQHGNITRIEKRFSTQTYVDRAIQFIKADPTRPFYLELFPNDVHDPHLPTDLDADKFSDISDNPFERKLFAVLQELDRQIGRVIETIDTLGLAENTLVIFTSDNGPTDWPSYYKAGQYPPGSTGPYYGRKWSLYEGGIRMPFIARWKGKIPAGWVNHQTVMCGIDLSPTFCALAGANTDGAVHHDGINQFEALTGKEPLRTKPVFWQYGKPYAQLMPGNPDFISPAYAVRDGDWKLLVDQDGSNTLLFNLASDPGETLNLLKAQPDKAGQLYALIQNWAQEVKIDVPAGNLTAKPADDHITIAPTPIASTPLFVDPHYHGSADPEIVWNSQEQEWWIFYTGRRAHRPDGTAAACPIGVAASKDLKNWRFVGYCQFDGEGGKPDANHTFWAPGIIRDGNTYHMYVTCKPGTDGFWGGEACWIQHYTAPAHDLLNGWKSVEETIVSDTAIDAGMFRTKDLWHMWYRDKQNNTMGIYYATSADLKTWQQQGLASGDANNKKVTGLGYQEAPYVFYWKNHYWMLTDPSGPPMAVYRSTDLNNWKYVGNILDQNGFRPTDTSIGRHPSVAVINDRAFIFYHCEARRDYAKPYMQNLPDQKTIYLQIAELNFNPENSSITCDRNKPVLVPTRMKPATQYWGQSDITTNEL